MVAILGHMDLFDVQNNVWSLYTEQLGQFFVASDIKDDNKKVAVLLTVIGSKAYELLPFDSAYPAIWKEEVQGIS